MRHFASRLNHSFDMPARTETLLAILPTRKDSAKWMTTPEVADRLKAHGEEVKYVKSVQRRLEALEREGVILCRRAGNALEWQREEGAGGIAARAGGLMTFDEALALQVLKRFANRRIPAMVSGGLKSLFAVAEERLARHASVDGVRHASWHHKVAVVDSGFQPQPPALIESVFHNISNALFAQCLMELVYLRRDAPPGTPPRRQRVLPLGMVETAAGVVYLVARNIIRDKVMPNPTMYRVDRMQEAEMLQETFVYPDDFVLASYVETERKFDFYPDGQIPLVLRFQAHAAHSVLDGRMAEDQTVEMNDDGTITVRGTVMLSDKLRWWIRAFGPGVEVMAPASLRDAFAEEARQTAARYAGDA